MVSAKNAVRQLQRLSIVPAIVIVGLLISNTVWIVDDQRVWPWDQAMYGDWTLRLWHARSLGPMEWLTSAAHALPAASPMIALIGQFFVPLRHLTGEFESAILFVNVFAAAGTLLLVYFTTRRLGGHIWSSLAGMVVCGGSGLFIGLTHQYLAELIQCFAAAFMMFVAWGSERRSLARMLSLTLIAISFSFLSKPSSGAFVLPMLTYILAANCIIPQDARPSFQLADSPLLLAAVLIGGATATWYAVNWNYIAQHFVVATVADTALNWGSPVILATKLNYWSGWFLKSLSPFLPISLCIVAPVIVSIPISITRLLKRLPEGWAQTSVENGTLFALALAGTIVGTLFAFSLQINEDTRFLLPLMPAAGILVGWSLNRWNQTIQALLCIVLVLNAAVNHAYAHGHNPFNIIPHNYLWQVDRNTSDKVLLSETVRSTCHFKTAGRPNFIIVSYRTLNVNSINFYSEKNRYIFGYCCTYETNYFMETNVDRALDRINAVAPAYVVTVVPEKQPARGSAPGFAPDFVNAVSRAVTEHLARDVRYTLAAGSGNYLLIYRDRSIE